MATESKREVWQRGPVEGIPALLQPVAHALLQAREEVQEIIQDFPNERLWERPAGVASVAFHLQHIAGVIDRLFTYAKGETLTEQQLVALKLEGIQQKLTTEGLLEAFQQKVDQAITQLSQTEESMLTQERLLGRAKISTTVIGLLFHAAEHIMRHVGQLLVTVRMVKEDKGTDQQYTQGH